MFWPDGEPVPHAELPPPFSWRNDVTAPFDPVGFETALAKIQQDCPEARSAHIMTDCDEPPCLFVQLLGVHESVPVSRCEQLTEVFGSNSSFGRRFDIDCGDQVVSVGLMTLNAAIEASVSSDVPREDVGLSLIRRAMEMDHQKLCDNYAPRE